MTIKYIFWNDKTGYGISAKQIIESLRNFSINVIPIGLTNPSGEYQSHQENHTGKSYKIVFIHSTPYYIERFIEPGKINIAYCTWETTVLPKKWVDVLNLCDAVFVPSTFNQICFIKSGLVKPVRILPHISEFSGIYTLTDRYTNNSRPYTFYSIGMWTNRKNNLSLMRAFQLAFNNKEPVRLVIKTSEKDYTKPAFSICSKSKFTYYLPVKIVSSIRKVVSQDQRITLYTKAWQTDQIRHLHAEGDCFISLCRSEGWGMGAYEAAWFGKPIIITGFGGQLDFLPKENAILLPYNLVKINEIVWSEYNTEGQEWAEVDINAAITAMREVYLNKCNYIVKGKLIKEYVTKYFNDNRIIELFIQDLQGLYAAQ